MPITPSSLQLIDALLSIPGERPEAVEAGSVECLRDELVAIRCVLIEEQAELQDAEVRRVSSYLSELHQRMLDIAENMVEVLSTAPTR